MKKAILIGFVVLGVVLYALATEASADSGRIYGSLRTIDGEVFEGWIRWDKNEAFWDDILDCNKENSRKYRSKRKSGRRSTGLGSLFEVSWSGSSRQSELKFGHISTITPISSGEALIELKSGLKYEVSGSDVGSGMREFLIDDLDEGEIYLEWDDIDEIDFKRESTQPSSNEERLYGKVTTRRGDDFVGWVEWDVDEVMTNDVLDGDEGSRKNRKIRFGKIQKIERRSSSSAIVTLKSGKEIRMSGSNDVDSGNRGIRVKVQDLGRVSVGWDEFDMVEFMPVPTQLLPNYTDFDGGRAILGTVFTEDGETFEGEIIWDDDERYTWEHLNGDFHDLDVAIEFSNVKVIEKHSRRGSLVTTSSGRNVLLKGSNDVNSENNGIIVKLSDGDEIEIDWYDFERAEFK